MRKARAVKDRGTLTETVKLSAIVAVLSYAISASQVTADEKIQVAQGQPSKTSSAPAAEASFAYKCERPTTSEMASHCEAKRANEIAKEANAIAAATAETGKWAWFAGALSSLASLGSVLGRELINSEWPRMVGFGRNLFVQC